MKFFRLRYNPSELNPQELRRNFQYFCEVIRWRTNRGNSPYPDLYHWLMNELQHSLDVEKTDDFTRIKDPDILLMLPRGSGKSTVFVIPYCAWRLYRDPSLRVAVCSASEGQAQKITMGVINIITNVLPNFYELDGKPKRLELTLKRAKQNFESGEINPSLWCFPIKGNSSVGSRADLIIADDPYTTENADTPQKAMVVKERFSALTDLWGERFDSQRITIVTRTDANDLANDLIESARYCRRRILCIPAVPYAKEKLLPKPPITPEECGKLVHSLTFFPKIFNPDKIHSAYNDPKRWGNQYQMRPPSQAMPTFLVENLQFKPAPPPEAFRRIIVAIDPAGCEGGDHFVMWHGGITVAEKGQLPKYYITGGWSTNEGDQRAITNNLSNLMDKPKTAYCYIESSNGYRWLRPLFGELCPRHAQRMKNFPPYNQRTKGWFIEGVLSPVFAGQRLIFDSNVFSPEHPMIKMLVKEMKRFDKDSMTTHDDHLDALRMLIYFLLKCDPAFTGSDVARILDQQLKGMEN